VAVTYCTLPSAASSVDIEVTRVPIAAVFDQLGPLWRNTRAAFNELARIVTDA
jgi:hypothetical protein